MSDELRIAGLLSDEQRARVAKLVAALRSGEFKQGRQQLKESAADDEVNPQDLHCCLGVACEVYRRDTGEGHWHGNTYVTSDGWACWDTPPHPVAEWYGFDENPALYYSDPDAMPGHMELATQLNDDRELTFAEIADAFEQTYLAPIPAEAPLPPSPLGGVR